MRLRDGTAATRSRTVRGGGLKFLTGKIAGYKMPRRVEFKLELPREDSGKIFKRKLREPFWENAGRSI